MTLFPNMLGQYVRSHVICDAIDLLAAYTLHFGFDGASYNRIGSHMIDMLYDNVQLLRQLADIFILLQRWLLLLCNHLLRR